MYMHGELISYVNVDLQKKEKKKEKKKRKRKKWTTDIYTMIDGRVSLIYAYNE
jgi:hypothetical protein